MARKVLLWNVDDMKDTIHVQYGAKVIPVMLDRLVSSLIMLA